MIRVRSFEQKVDDALTGGEKCATECCVRCGSAFMGATMIYVAQSISIVALVLVIISAIVGAISSSVTAVILAITGAATLLISAVIALIGMAYLKRATE